MFKFKADTNIINKKSIILIIVSFLTTYFLTRNSKNKNKKKSKIHTFKKTYSFFDGLISNTNNKLIAYEIKKDNNEIKIEEAIMIDV